MTKNSRGIRIAVTALAVLACTGLTTRAWAVATTKTEGKCASSLGKAGQKVVKTALKEIARCREDDISHKLVGTCPNAGNTTKIDAAATAAADAATKSCFSTCSI